MARLTCHELAATAGSTVAVALAVADIPSLAALSIAVGTGVGAVATDLRERRIPTRLVALGAVGTVVALAVLTAVHHRNVGPAFVGGVVLGGVLLVMHLVQPAGVGFGDVRLAALLGVLVGIGTGSFAAPVLVALAASAAASMWMLARRARTAPFAPFLVGASIAAIVGFSFS